jgi:hypothetical protein
LIFATPSLSPGTSFVKNDLRVIASEDGGDASEFNIGGAYIDRFGSFTAGANIWVGVRVINANGQASPMELQRAVITA